MKKNLFVASTLLLSVFCLSNLKAQDFIYPRDQSARIAATHVDIDKTETRYQHFEGSTSAVFALNNSDINMIVFEDGTVRFIENEDLIKKIYDYNKNLFTFHLFDLIIN